jgi:hypothetical protein
LIFLTWETAARLEKRQAMRPPFLAIRVRRPLLAANAEERTGFCVRLGR